MPPRPSWSAVPPPCATISGNTGSIYGNVIGIDVDGGSAAISGNHIYGNTIGIKLENGGAGSDRQATISRRRCTANGTDLLVASSAGTISPRLRAIPSPEPRTSTTRSSQPINATSDTFGSVTPSDNTPADLYGVENQITDYLDNPSLGYVSLRTNAVYVTQASESATAGAIQRGVNVAPSAGTVYVQGGTYDYNLSSGLNINKSLSLVGPNAGVSGGGSRVAEAILNGGASGTLTGGGASINIGGGSPLSLTFEGLEFTDFDTWHVFYEGGGTPITSAVVTDNVFTGNNGGIFTKYNTSLASQFDVTDNLIVNQTMSGGANTALFFLGDVANSHFDDNQVQNGPSRELFNTYDSVTNTTFDGNTMSNSGLLTDLCANMTGVEINGNTLSNVSAAYGPGAIVVDTYIGQAVSGLDIENNTITGAGGSGIELLADGQDPYVNDATIQNVTISGNSISSTAAYGIDVDTTASGNDRNVVISNITIENNTLTDNT